MKHTHIGLTDLEAVEFLASMLRKYGKFTTECANIDNRWTIEVVADGT